MSKFRLEINVYTIGSHGCNFWQRNIIFSVQCQRSGIYKYRKGLCLVYNIMWLSGFWSVYHYLAKCCNKCLVNSACKFRVREIRWTRRTCPVNFGKCPAKGFDLAGHGGSKSRTLKFPVISLIVTPHFTVKCPARIQNVQQRTGGSLDKMSSKPQMFFRVRF